MQSAVAASLEAQDLTLDMLQEEARYILGRDVAFTEEQLAQALDPERFVAVRTLPGGVAPSATARLLDAAATEMTADEKWLATARGRIEKANAARAAARALS